MKIASTDFPDPKEVERDLVARLLEGDERAFETLADDYFPGLLRFALGRLGKDYELARELVQSTVCKAVTNLETFRGDASLFTWLCACCRNEIALHFRTQGRAPRLVELEETTPGLQAMVPPSGRRGPEANVLRGEEASLVHQTLDELPPRYGKALEWKYIDGLSVKEIAQRLETGPKAAESVLTRARLAFRKGFESLQTSSKTAPAVSFPQTLKKAPQS
ncbi:MAG: RNA polymerase sigma factor [Deltaproteobacteria bacterium]|nr:RNA polymerase sigma factor [Deltaproteobacteria bacterium]